MSMTRQLGGFAGHGRNGSIGGAKDDVNSWPRVACSLTVRVRLALVGRQSWQMPQPLGNQSRRV
jgi:hypothetical protein